jgi:murein L,D-transpeptidase YcbB/YkuD
VNDSCAGTAPSLLAALSTTHRTPWRRALCGWALFACLCTPLATFADTALPWFDGERPHAQALAAVALLQAATTQGLEPTDYDAPRLAAALQQAQRQSPVATREQRGQLDDALTQAFQRYLSDLTHGRIAPARIGEQFAPTRRSTIDTAALLVSALSASGTGVDTLARQLAQNTPMAQALGGALQQYLALGPHPAWTTPLPPPVGGKLVAGQAYAGMQQLARRLQTLGDLDPAMALPAVIDAPLVAAIARFQLRHGLQVDGVVGRNTLRQLDVTPQQRARQIAVTMERMRWTPLLQAPRMIVVNVPEFVLRACEVQQGRIDVKLSMNIIVGKALDTRTPLFDEEMRFIEFSPYWNVPRSIAHKELVPRLRLEPAYFAQQGFEFVTGSGRVVTTLDDAQLDAVMAGTSRIRQRPGPRNALGDIKFIFPNNDAIFLHHTPTPGLFARPRRDFSHGCVRVEDPVALARFVLQDDPQWTEQRIREAMDSGSSRTIRLRETIPVLLAYQTVVLKQSMVFFLDDVYGHDATLAQALQERSRTLRHAAIPDNLLR